MTEHQYSFIKIHFFSCVDVDQRNIRDSVHEQLIKNGECTIPKPGLNLIGSNISDFITSHYSPDKINCITYKFNTDAFFNSELFANKKNEYLKYLEEKIKNTITEFDEISLL